MGCIYPHEYNCIHEDLQAKHWEDDVAPASSWVFFPLVVPVKWVQLWCKLPCISLYCTLRNKCSFPCSDYFLLGSILALNMYNTTSKSTTHLLHKNMVYSLYIFQDFKKEEIYHQMSLALRMCLTIPLIAQWGYLHKLICPAQRTFLMLPLKRSKRTLTEALRPPTSLLCMMK